MYSEKNTKSLCPTCYKEIPAAIFFRDQQVWMRKRCTEHGETEAMVEPDEMFYRTCRNPDYLPIATGVFVDVTRRCNMDCPYCFSGVQNASQDPSIENLIQTIEVLGVRNINYFGGEPTLREDLFELSARLTQMGKHLTMASNGLRLADRDYLREMLQSGLRRVAFTLNSPTCNPGNAFAQKMQAVENFRALNEKLTCLMFSIESLDELPEIMKIIRENTDVSKHFRIRSVAKVGACPEKGCHTEIFVSDIYKALKKVTPITPLDHQDNNLYHFNVRTDDGIYLRLIKCPDVNNIDLIEQGDQPAHLGLDGVVRNFIHSLIVNEGIAKGWLAGHRIKDFVQI